MSHFYTVNFRQIIELQTFDIKLKTTQAGNNDYKKIGDKK